MDTFESVLIIFDAEPKSDDLAEHARNDVRAYLVVVPVVGSQECSLTG
jgi:hypothetical protein